MSLNSHRPLPPRAVNPRHPLGGCSLAGFCIHEAEHTVQEPLPGMLEHIERQDRDELAAKLRSALSPGQQRFAHAPASTSWQGNEEVPGTVETFGLTARARMAWRVLRGRPMFDAEPMSFSEFLDSTEGQRADYYWHRFATRSGYATPETEAE